MKTLRIGGVPEHFNLPWLLAIEAGAFQSLGLDVRFTEYPGGTGAMAEALAASDIDVALMLTEGAVLDVLRGGDHRLVRIFVTSSLVWGIHVPTGSDLTDAGAMEGRTVAISRYGSGSHLIAVVDAIERGFDPAAMDFVVVDDLAGARHALGAGEAEVFLWERHMTQPLVDKGELRRIGERVVPWPAFVASARTAVIESMGLELAAVLDTAATFAARFKTDPGAARLVSERYGLAPEDAARWLEGVTWCNDDSRPDAALERVVLALEAQGAIGTDRADRVDPWHILVGRGGPLSAENQLL